MENGWDRRRRRIRENLERVAISLFAERGFHDVTLDEVAEEAGVSTRTLTRYYATKEDLLLEMPRRASQAMAEALADSEMGAEPAAELFQLWQRLTAERRAEVADLADWRRAALGAPEVVARARGEQSAILNAQLVDVFANAMQLSPRDDVRPHVLGAAVAAANGAVVEFWMAHGARGDLESLFAEALASLHHHFSSPRVRRAVRSSLSSAARANSA